MEILQITPGKARAVFKENMWTSDRWVGEPKIDGSRYLMHVGVGESRFTSRHESKKTGLFVEKSKNIPHLQDLFMNENVDVDLAGCVFDGEIVRGGLLSKSSEVTKIMGSLPEKAIQIQQESGYVDYFVFDILFDHEGNDIRGLPYESRRNIMLGYLSEIADPKKHLNIIPVERQDKERFYQEIIAAGGEGVILKDSQAPYAQGWAKVKRHATFDVIITGYEEPTKITKKSSGEESASRLYDNGWIGALVFGQYFEGKLVNFGSCSGMDDAMREEISLNKEKYIGKVIEVMCQERLVSGRLRHPRFLRFRPDKNPEECVYRPNES
jgi:ATP-dependent DNA ligase